MRCLWTMQVHVCGSHICKRWPLSAPSKYQWVVRGCTKDAPDYTDLWRLARCAWKPNGIHAMWFAAGRLFLQNSRRPVKDCTFASVWRVSIFEPLAMLWTCLGVSGVDLWRELCSILVDEVNPEQSLYLNMNVVHFLVCRFLAVCFFWWICTVAS